MKLLIILTTLILGSMTANAGTCNLDYPITFSGNLLSGVHLKNVVLDEVPRFMPEEGYNPTTDPLDVEIFNINWNEMNLGYVGSQILIHDNYASLGFANKYSGNFYFEGNVSEIRGAKTYRTKTSRTFSEPQHAKNEAVTENIITVIGDKILSINLTYPIFKVWKTDSDGMQHTAFTGEHQTVCVKSAH